MSRISESNKTAGPIAVVVVCSLLIAAPWFWPFLWGPLSAMWPDLFAWTMGSLLIVLLPLTRERAGLTIASGWLLAALGSALLGLLQYFDLENGFYPWVVPTEPGYVTANVHQLNMLATLLSVGLLCVWWLLIKHYLVAIHAVWMSCLLLLALAATASRTGLVNLVVISCMLLCWHPRQWRRLLLILGMGWSFYSIVASGLPWVAWVTRDIVIDRNLFGRFGENVTCHSRRILWSNVIDLISLKPWAGWGPGELPYAQYITKFDGERFCEKLSHAHNLPLQIAVTMGIPVALICGLFFLLSFFKLKPWAATHPMERLCWGVLALLGVHSLLEYPLWFGVFQLMALLAVWQIYRSRSDRVSAREQPVSPIQSIRGHIAMSTFLLAGLSFVAWDYLKVSQLYVPTSMRLDRYREDTFNKSRDTALFNSHVLIAQVVTMELTPPNAELILEGALASLHTAPDSRVIRRVIEAAVMLDKPELVNFHMTQYKAAWPIEYEEWVQLNQASIAKP